jgi:hypothetical protein
MLKLKIFIFKGNFMDYEQLPLETIIKKIENNEYVLPNFQRGFVWSLEAQKKLIASIIVRIPIGSTLHLKGKKNSFSARALCENIQIQPQKEECEYILDGQQRLSTLKNTFYNVYENRDWKDVWDKLFANLRYRWFINLRNDDNDFFGYKKLFLNKEKIFEAEPREILDLITFKKILKTKDLDKWFHPGYIPKEDNKQILGTHEKKLHIARKAKEEKLIPLYEIYKEDGIHTKIIELLAKDRLDEIKAKLNDLNKEEFNSFVIEYLKPIEPDIENLVNQIEKKDIISLFEELKNKWIRDFSDFLKRLIEIKMPIIRLEEKEAGRASAIFEEINKGGTPLSIYDLLVAKAATSNSEEDSLTNRIIKLLNTSYKFDFERKEFHPTCMTSTKENTLSSKFQSIYLNSLAIIIAKKKNIPINKKTISRNNILSLSATDINNYNEEVIKSIIKAFAFLQFRCGVISEKNIIYDYMILPIVYYLNNEQNNTKEGWDYLEAWYWSSLFSGKYKERQDDQFISDIKNLHNYSKEEILNERILNTPDYSNLETLLNKNEALNNEAPKAMKEGILQYVLSTGPLDFLPNEDNTLSAQKSACDNITCKDSNLKKYKLQAHHIIPLGTLTKIGENSENIRKDKTHILNSPLNLTYISECANSKISDMDYEKYASELKHKIETHFLTPEKIESKKDIENMLTKRFEKIKVSIIKEINSLWSE